MDIRNNAEIKNNFKANKPFSIYNCVINSNIDHDTQFYHINCNYKQQFVFVLDQQQFQDNYLYGRFFNQHYSKYIIFKEYGIQFAKSEYPDQQRYTTAIQINDKGMVSISAVKDNIIRYTISPLYDPVSKKHTYAVDETKQPHFDWFLINKKDKEFKGKEVIITCYPDQTYALNSRTGERWVRKEIYDMYDKSKHIYKTQMNSEGFITFLQQNGEFYISARNEVAVFSPFTKGSSEWTVLQNFLLKEQHFLLSQEKYFYLTDKQDQLMNLSKAAFKDGQQSFNITIQENTEMDLEGENINDYDKGGIKEINLNQNYRQQQGLPYNYLNQFQEIQSNPQQQNQMQLQYQQHSQNQILAKNGSKIVGSTYSNQIGSYNGSNNSITQSQANEKFTSKNAINFDKFKGGSITQSCQDFQQPPINSQAYLNQQQKNPSQQLMNQNFKKVKICNQGSGRYLKVSDQDVIESDQLEASEFVLKYIKKDQVQICFKDSVLSTVTDSPINPIRVINKIYDIKKSIFQIQSDDQNRSTFLYENSSLQIIGGKLFISQLKFNQYNIFCLQN